MLLHEGVLSPQHFDETTAELMIGKQLPGSIIKEECEPYSFETDNGQTIELAHRWTYSDKTVEELAIDKLVTSISENGTTIVEEPA